MHVVVCKIGTFAAAVRQQCGNSTAVGGSDAIVGGSRRQQRASV